MPALRWHLLLAGAVLAGHAEGGEVYRCGQGEAVRYQDVACAPDEAGGLWRGARGVAPSSADGLARLTRVPAPARRRGGRGKPATGRAAMALIALERDPDGCARTRALRLQALQRRTRTPDYLTQRAWDDRVRDACR